MAAGVRGQDRPVLHARLNIHRDLAIAAYRQGYLRGHTKGQVTLRDELPLVCTPPTGRASKGAVVPSQGESTRSGVISLRETNLGRGDGTCPSETDTSPESPAGWTPASRTRTPPVASTAAFSAGSSRT